MNLVRATYLLLILFGWQSAALAQVDTTAVDTTALDTTAIDTALVDSLYLMSLDLQRADTTAADSIDIAILDDLFLVPLDLAGTDTTETESEEPLFKVTPWEFHAPIGANLADTDSTLRWQMWPDWTYKLNREPGVISYRLGTHNRSNAVQRHAHEPRHQQLCWQGISMNDPVSGRVNWSLIPRHKISRFYNQDLGTQYRSTYYLHQYYLNEPLSRLIYTESKFSFRDLEFEVSHNLSQRTNIELSYWDQRTGGEYPNANVSGRQIYVKASHHLDHRRYLKFNFVNNNYDMGQPFGYNIPNLFTYNFDRYNTTANQPGGFTEEKTSLWTLNFYQRSPDTTKATDNLHAGIFYRGNERNLTYTADSTGYKLRSLGANAKKWWSLGGLTLEAGAGYERFFNRSDEEYSFPADDWSQLNAEGRVSLDFTDIIDVKGGTEFNLRSDGFQSYRINATSDIQFGKLTLTPGVSTGNIMPTLQQLYWSSEAYSGNSALQNEKVREARGTVSYHFTSETKIGVRGQHKDIEDGIMVVDSSFANVPSYASQSATAFFEWDHTHFELNGSATVQRFTDSYLSPTNTIPMRLDERIWLKGGAYWKGYFFDRATYVKAGVSGMMAPFRYQADHYYPELNSWQPVSDDQVLPLFNRLDVDISARVRSIIFTLRWENVLDDVQQLGYFETAQYPMTQRRFIFGVKALFRN